jgi:hypothetical protein
MPRASARLAELTPLQGAAFIDADADDCDNDSNLSSVVDNSDEISDGPGISDMSDDDAVREVSGAPKNKKPRHANVQDARRPPPAKKKRGRPPKAKEPPPALFHDDMDEELMPAFSLTYGKKGDHMPPVWFVSMTDFLNENSPAYLNARERGAKQEHLHGQAITKLPCGIDKAECERIKKAMKAALGAGVGSGCIIDFKPLVTGQTFTRMVGYCLKDQGLPHFLMTSKGVTQEEMDLGIAEHTALKLNYMDGLIPLNKSNLFQRSHTFWNNYMVDVPNAGFTDVLAEMINSKKYMLSSTLLMNTNGQMRPEAAEAYWAIVQGATCTKFDMMKIIYLPTSGANPYRHVQAGMIHESPADATPRRPTVRSPYP